MNKFDMAETAKRLRSRRKQDLKMKQAEVAEKAGITLQSLSTYENGSIPRMDILWPLADALECEPDYLLGRIDHPKRTTSDISKLIPLSREAIESLEHLSFAIKSWSDFDSLLISCILNDLIIYFVDALSMAANFDGEKLTFKEGLFDDVTEMLFAYERLSSEEHPDDYSNKYNRLVVRGTKTSIGDRLADCVANTITKIAAQQEEK
jgi:transcriptional regulator with XRE-family HTH domain